MMKKNIRYLFLLLFVPSLLSGQDKESVFAFVRTGTSGTYGHEAGDDFPEFPVVDEILQRLITAKGDKQRLAPELVMANAAQYVAWMDPDPGRPVIGMETKAYEVCRSFGADSLNALAALLAHELTHYYERHGWARRFAAEAKSELGEKLGKEENSLTFETQADYLGGFLAHAAGYSTLGLMPELLKRLYEAYELDAELEGYPSLEERRRESANQEEKVKRLADVYDMSTLLLSLERFADARLYLRHILEDFQSRELYNNLGVLSVLEALPQFSKSEVFFALPIELDADGRLKQGATRNPCQTKDCKQGRMILLEAAIRDFDQSIALDPDYTTAFLNKAIAYYLLNLQEDAEYFASRALRMAKKQELKKATADAWILLGVIAATREEDKRALEHFEKAEALGSTLASKNLRILKQEGTAVFAVRRSAKGLEMIDSLRPEAFLSKPVIDREIKVGEDVILGVAEKEQSTVFFHFADNGRDYAFFHLSNEGYSGKTNMGIKAGNPEAQVVQYYQTPYRRLELRSGTVLVYPSQLLLFFLDDEGNVQRWAVFREKTSLGKR